MQNQEQQQRQRRGRRSRSRPSSSRLTGHTIVPFAFERILPEDIQGTKKIPVARSGHRIVCDDDDNIYSYGGYNPLTTADDFSDDPALIEYAPMLRELWKFNPSTKKWTKLRTKGSQPQQLASHSVTLFAGTQMLVYGGTGYPFGHNSSNRIYCCDLRTLSWKWLKPTNTSRSEDSEEPIKQYGQAVVLDEVNCHLYSVGGTTGHQYSIDVHCFDLLSRRWTALWKKSRSGDDFPEERYRHEIVLFDGKIFAFGGGTDQVCFSFKKIPVFDLESRTWSAIESNPGKPASTPLPNPRRCLGCVMKDHYVYINGGMDGVQVFGDVWRFDLRTHDWEKILVTLPTSLFFHAVTLSPTTGRMFTFGGVNQIVNSANANVRVNDLYSVYLGIPSLQELAWSTFLSFCRRDVLRKSSRLDLFDLGIPSKFVRRLSEDLVSGQQQETSFEEPRAVAS